MFKSDQVTRRDFFGRSGKTAAGVAAASAFTDVPKSAFGANDRINIAVAGIRINNLFYGVKGWMHLNDDKWTVYMGRQNRPGEKYEGAGTTADPDVLAGAGGSAHLNDDALEGYLSTSLSHIANVSCRLGRELEFDSHNKGFVPDEQANGYLTRDYRFSFAVPENITFYYNP